MRTFEGDCEKLRALMPALDAATKKVDDLIDDVETCLVESGIGMKVKIVTKSIVLEYGKYEGKFRILINEEPYQNSTREGRIEACGLLPRLLNEISRRVESSLENSEKVGRLAIEYFGKSLSNRGQGEQADGMQVES